MAMKLIVGLGNPGAEYEDSRHNVGFRVIDVLAQRWWISTLRRKHQGLCGGGQYRGVSVTLLKPQTYMNRSGASVAEAVGFYKTALDDLLVIVDDMALELGRLRLRPRGSAGGHNGLKDIIAHLGDGFGRLRIGIGGARHGDAIDHVLGRFQAPEQVKLNETLDRAADAAATWLVEGMEPAMTRFNAPPPTPNDDVIEQ